MAVNSARESRPENFATAHPESDPPSHLALTLWNRQNTVHGRDEQIGCLVQYGEYHT